MSSLPSHLGGHKSRTHIDVGVLKFARDKLKVKSINTFLRFVNYIKLLTKISPSLSII